MHDINMESVSVKLVILWKVLAKTVVVFVVVVVGKIVTLGFAINSSAYKSELRNGSKNENRCKCGFRWHWDI